MRPTLEFTLVAVILCLMVTIVVTFLVLLISWWIPLVNEWVSIPDCIMYDNTRG